MRVKTKTSMVFVVLLLTAMLLVLMPAAAGEVAEPTGPHAEFHFKQEFVVHTQDDSITSGTYERNMWYHMHIHNSRDTSGTVLGDLSFSAWADGIQDVDWAGYATWDEH